MRVLLLHADSFTYSPTKKAVSQADDVAMAFSTKNALVVLTTVEENDDERVIEAASSDIAEHMSRVRADSVVIYPYAHLSSDLAPLHVAREIIEKLSEALKRRGIETHKAPFGWYKAFEIKVHGHPMAELSRSYSAVERLPPLIETSRDFADRLYNDYLKRFGFHMYGDRVFIDALWLSAIDDLGSSLSSCQTIEGDVETKYILNERLRECTRYSFEALAQPIRAVFIERGIVTDSSRLRDVVGEFSVIEEERFVWLEGRGFRALIALKTEDGKYLAALNTLLIGLIAANVERMSYSQVIPSLPVRYAVVQAYVAANPPVSQSYIKRVKDEIQGVLKRIIVDDSGVRLAEKLRKAGMLWSPLTIIVGKMEEETSSVSIRTRVDGKTRTVMLSELREVLRTFY